MKVILLLISLIFLIPAMILLFKESKKADTDTRSQRTAGYALLMLAAVFGICGKLTPKSDTNTEKVTIITPTTNEIPPVSEAARTSTRCSICGRLFDGAGYYEVSEGVWQLCTPPSFSFICSIECGMKHTREMNSFIDGTYSNSPSNSATNHPRTVGDTYEHEKQCEVCEGKGWYVGGMNGEVQKCLTCNGTGKIKY